MYIYLKQKYIRFHFLFELFSNLAIAILVVQFGVNGQQWLKQALCIYGRRQCLVLRSSTSTHVVELKYSWYGPFLPSESF